MNTRRSLVDTPVRDDLSEHLEGVRTALEQQRQFRLDQLRELADVGANSQPAIEDVHDEVNDLLRTGAATALAEVEDALDRLAAGTYGICERCSTTIPRERLEILPMSRFCMGCQRVLERRAS